MFWNRNKINRKMIDQIRPTSKASLKAQCLKTCDGDIDKAEKLYAFMIRDMEDLPMFDILPPSTFSQVKESVAGSFNWIKENQADIMQGIQMIRALFGKGGGFPPAGSAPQVPVEPIPPIQ